MWTCLSLSGLEATSYKSHTVTVPNGIKFHMLTWFAYNKNELMSNNPLRLLLFARPCFWFCLSKSTTKAKKKDWNYLAKKYVCKVTISIVVFYVWAGKGKYLKINLLASCLVFWVFFFFSLARGRIHKHHWSICLVLISPGRLWPPLPCSCIFESSPLLTFVFAY